MMRNRFERLGLGLVRKYGPEKLKQIAEKDGGTYEEKCLLREIVANYLWSTVPKEAYAHLKQRQEISSMFLTMAFTTCFLLVFQFLFYLNHVFQEGLILPDIVISALLGYIVINLISNAMTPPKQSPDGKTRKSHYFLVFAIVGLLVSLFHLNIFAFLPWFTVADSLLLIFFIILYCALYWAGAYRYDHYILEYEHLLQKNAKKIIRHTQSNCKSILETIHTLAPRPSTKRSRNLTIALSVLAISLSVIILLNMIQIFIDPSIGWQIITPSVWFISDARDILFILLLTLILTGIVSMGVFLMLEKRVQK